MKKKVLKATGISKAFRHPVELQVLQNVNLEVDRGETVAIMGASGEGKSTLLHILGTLEQPCTGSLSVAGVPVSTSSRNNLRNQHIGFIFQSFHLLEDYTVLDNVLMPARIARVNTSAKSAARARALELLERVGLEKRADYFTKTLSGGEKQRCAIARALCNDPDLILADEPTGNLDHHNSQKIHELLLGFAKETSKALVVVTHDQELAAVCDRTLHLRDGRL